MNKPLIIADGVLPEARAFHDARDALVGWPEIVLFSQVAEYVGQQVPEGSVIYNLEPLYDGCQSVELGYLDTLRRFPVLDYQRRNIEYLRAFGINAAYMPYGHHPSMRRVEQRVEANKDIDVLFFGSLISERRRKILEQFEGSSVTCTIATDCYGTYRDEMVARAKIIINIHRLDEHPLEVVRLNYLLANGAFVISERGWDDDDNVKYSPGLVYADPEDLVTACHYFLKNPDLRNDIAERGVALVEAMPQSRFIEQARTAQLGKDV